MIFSIVFLLRNVKQITLGEAPPYCLDQRAAAKIEYVFAKGLAGKGWKRTRNHGRLSLVGI